MSAPSQAPGNDRSMDGLIFVAVLIIVMYMMAWMGWRMMDQQILSGLFFVVGWLSKAIQYVPWLYPDTIGSSLSNWATSLAGASPKGYGWPAAKLLIQTISHTLTLLLVPYLLFRMFRLRRVHVINRFTRTFNLDMLKQRNADKYAAIASIQHEDLLNTPLHTGPLAIARSPIDYSLLNELIQVRKKRIGADALAMIGLNSNATDEYKPIKGWSEKKIRWSVAERRRVMPPPSSCRLDINKTDALLRKQLGGLFDYKALDKFERCVLAILYTANAVGLGDARELALKLAKSYRRCDKKGRHAPRIVDTGIDEIIKKHQKHPIISRIHKQHAFKATVFMGLLEASWKKGIFTAPEFLWFKGTNRTLFMALCFLGGDEPCVEAAGPWAHFLLEQRVGRAIKDPCVEAGTDALEKMLFNEEWIGSDDGTISEVTEKAALGLGDDEKYSPTKGIDLFDPVKR